MSTDECDYCGRSFDDEETYLSHLRDEHGDELGPIEERRVAALDRGGDGPSAALYAGAVGVLALLGLLVYVVFFMGGGATGTDGSSGSGEPYDVGSVHTHGPITVTIDGQELDFSRDKFQLQADAFHFERRNGDRWHVHAKGVTLKYAMGTLGIEVTENTVAYNGTTYGDDPGETAVVEVNGKSVNPNQYVLQDGDRIRIVANESG